MNYSTEIARALLAIKAVKLNPQDPFTWASGIRSPIYCDNRIALSHPKVRSLILDGFLEMTRFSGKLLRQPEFIAGVATAGIPHGALLADRLNLPFVYVRSKPKAHGRQNLIEGDLKPGARILVIEDLISTGGSSIEAVKALQAAGGEVLGVFAIFTYGFEQAKQNFSTVNCPFHTLTNYMELISIALDIGYIDGHQHQELVRWRENPQQWQTDRG